MKTSTLTYLLIIILLSISSCFPEEDTWQEDGLAPIYADPNDFSLIFSGPAMPSVDQGSFVENNGFIYINERFKGIHVFDNSNLGNPIKVYFWHIPGNSEFTVDGNFLYADNSRHFITIDISDPANIKVLSHVKDLFSNGLENENYPKNYRGVFECVEFEKGIVVGWENQLLDSPKCRTVF